MRLHKSQRTDLDYLLDNTVIEYCNFDRFDLNLVLSSTPAEKRWPTVKIWMDTELVAEKTVANGKWHFDFSTKVDLERDHVCLEIEYVDKTDRDTVIDAQGSIVQNQSVTIEKIFVNDVDLLETNMIYTLGHYTPELSPEKTAYYLKQGYSIEPSHTLTMYENGRWQMRMPLPISTNFVRTMAKQEAHEKWPDPELLTNIIKTVNTIRDLERKIKKTYDDQSK